MVVVPRHSHHRHTGRLRPHHETSYALLVFVLMLAGVLLAIFSLGADAATEGGGSYKIEAVVGGPRPSTPATITSPVSGQVFQTNPISVEGTCPDRTLIKVFKNGVLAGSTFCGQNRRFSLQVDLVVGKNDLTALPYNALEDAGPTSPTVNVTLNVPTGGLGFSTELLLGSVNYYRGAMVGDTVVWPVTIVGGQAPYAVLFDWGDGTSDLTTRTASGPFDLSHVYHKAGGYLGSFPLIIRATDAAGHSAYLQLTTIINQTAAATSTTTGTTKSLPANLLMMWPIWGMLVVMVVSFWLGERREKHVLTKRMELTV